jgi:hypothetical protein
MEIDHPIQSPIKMETNETERYIQSLCPKKYKAYLIAKSHLGSTFNLEKSIGYRAWQNIQKEKETENLSSLSTSLT